MPSLCLPFTTQIIIVKPKFSEIVQGDFVLLGPRMSRNAALEALVGDNCVKTTSWKTSLMHLYRLGWACWAC